MPLNYLKELAGTTGLEPATSDVTGRRSNQLNYVPACCLVSDQNNILSRPARENRGQKIADALVKNRPRQRRFTNPGLADLRRDALSTASRSRATVDWWNPHSPIL